MADRPQRLYRGQAPLPQKNAEPRWNEACPRRSQRVVPDKLRNGLRGQASLQQRSNFPVGAVLAREEVDALCQTNCAMAFAGKPRSNRDRISLWERCLPAMNDDAVCQINRGALIAGKPSTYRRLKASLERGLPAKKSMRCARQTAQWPSRASHAPTDNEISCRSELARDKAGTAFNRLRI